MAPTEVTYGHVPGNEGLKVPDVPLLKVPPAHLALVQHWPPLPATPESPEEYRMETPARPSFMYLCRRGGLAM